LRQATGDAYALATRKVAIDGISLLVNMAEFLADAPQWVRARPTR